MPKGVYQHKKQSPEMIEKRIYPLRGRKRPKSIFNEEWRKKQSLAHLGKTVSWVGIKRTEEQKEKNRLAHLGNKDSEETKIKKSLSHKLLTHSETHNKNVSLAKKGKPNKKIRGSNHWNWKGGSERIQKILRTNYKYRQWVSDVFTRDDFTCQDCGLRSGKGKAVYLSAHHIDRFIDIIKRNNIENIDQGENCEELWNINNGVTLCKQCHKVRHGWG